jgi:hypothetical protein
VRTAAADGPAAAAAGPAAAAFRIMGRRWRLTKATFPTLSVESVICTRDDFIY